MSFNFILHYLLEKRTEETAVGSLLEVNAKLFRLKKEPKAEEEEDDVRERERTR